jgi:signal transduction histidine kinase
MAQHARSTAPRDSVAAAELTAALDELSHAEWLAERERLGRELHDNVMQRLFATGVGLQALAGKVTDPVLAARLEEHIADLGETLDEVRTTVYRLRRGLAHLA